MRRRRARLIAVAVVLLTALASVAHGNFTVTDQMAQSGSAFYGVPLRVVASIRNASNAAQTINSITLATSGNATCPSGVTVTKLFGGAVMNDFAFTFLVGILTGTYSSIYIACAIVLWWHKGKRPELSMPVLSGEPAPSNA